MRESSAIASLQRSERCLSRYFAMLAVRSVGIFTSAKRAAVCSAIHCCLLRKASSSTCFAMAPLIWPTNRAWAMFSGGMTFATLYAAELPLDPRDPLGARHRVQLDTIVLKPFFRVRFVVVAVALVLPVAIANVAGHLRPADMAGFAFSLRDFPESAFVLHPSANASHGNRPRLTTSIERAARALVSSTSVWKIIEPCASASIIANMRTVHLARCFRCDQLGLSARGW
jgi:hypothetical protein